MKQFIVMSAMIVLGTFIYGLIAGQEAGSITDELAGVWRCGIETRTYGP